MFKNGNADLLVIESSGGYGKSQLVQEVMKDMPHLKITSHITPLSFYIQGYYHKDMPIILDDTDSLLSDENNVALLKMFAETSKIKEVSWFSTSEILDRYSVPQKYETQSRIIIICNSFAELSSKISALRDRGWHIRFEPTDEEILNKIKEIIPVVAKDMSYEEKLEVFNLIKEYSKFCEFSLRNFVKGIFLYQECKNKGIDWRNIILNDLKINPKLVLVNDLINKYAQDKERIEGWEKEGFSKRSFYDYKNLLLQKCSHI